jgi:phosphomannomutase
VLGKVFKAYDIRAPYPKPLSDKMAWQIGYATARYLVAQAEEAGFDDPMMRHIVLGRDMRKSSPALVAAFRKGVNDFGAHVIDVGLADTPLVSFAINFLGCCGGVQTTASHNPPNYNGFKISGIGARPIGMDTGLEEIRRLAAMTERDKIVPAKGRGETRDLWDAYREHVQAFFHPSLLDGTRSLRVVIDASNGMGGTMVPKVFRGVRGLKITQLNFDNQSGVFAHPPDPLVVANLKQLRETVLEEQADLGICFDGDADRCVVVDEKAHVVGGDLLTAWLARHLLAGAPGSAVVYDLRSTKAVPEIIAATGGKPVRSRVGHVFMKQQMARHQAVFGGELSGHFYFRDNFYADSGAIASALVLSALALAGGPMSAQIEPLRRYAQSGEINFHVEDKEAALQRLRHAYPRARVDDLDGVTLELGEWWCNVRPSNTEPLLRLNLEGRNQETVKKRVLEVSELLKKPAE